MVRELAHDAARGQPFRGLSRERSCSYCDPPRNKTRERRKLFICFCFYFLFRKERSLWVRVDKILAVSLRRSRSSEENPVCSAVICLYNSERGFWGCVHHGDRARGNTGKTLLVFLCAADFDAVWTIILQPLLVFRGIAHRPVQTQLRRRGGFSPEKIYRISIYRSARTWRGWRR